MCVLYWQHESFSAESPPAIINTPRDRHKTWHSRSRRRAERTDWKRSITDTTSSSGDCYHTQPAGAWIRIELRRHRFE